MFYSYKYNNGLTAIISPQLGTKAATVLIAVKVGSRFEPNKYNGIAHFTEHLMFKGTKRRPSTLLISRELDSIGADYNAFTGKEYTGYYIKADARHLSLSLDILADMLNNSLFSEQEIAREKGVIVEEINMYEDAPMMMLEDEFDACAYPASQLGRNIAGTKETVNSFTRKDFINFIERYYTASNMLVVIAGKVDQLAAQEYIEKLFRHTKKGTESKFKKIKIQQKKAKILVKDKQTEQIHLALGFTANINHRSPVVLPLKIANIAFGGNMSSRLFINIRERQGLCYYVRSRVNTYHDTGSFVVYAGLDKNRLEQAVGLIIKEYKKIKAQGITKSEFNKAKDFIRGKTVLALEDSSQVAQWYADRWLSGHKIETPEQYLDRLEKINLTDIHQALKQVINKQKLNLAIIGQIADKRNLNKYISF